MNHFKSGNDPWKNCHQYELPVDAASLFGELHKGLLTNFRHIQFTRDVMVLDSVAWWSSFSSTIGGEVNCLWFVLWHDYQKDREKSIELQYSIHLLLLTFWAFMGNPSKAINPFGWLHLSRLGPPRIVPQLLVVLEGNCNRRTRQPDWLEFWLCTYVSFSMNSLGLIPFPQWTVREIQGNPTSLCFARVPRPEFPLVEMQP